MKLNILAASTVCLLLGDPPFVFGQEDNFDKLETRKATSSNLRSKDRNLSEQDDLWRLLLSDQTSFPPSPRPSPRPTPLTFSTMQPTSFPTTLQPVLPQDEQCELEMAVQCVVPDGDFRIPCGDVPKPEDEPFCRKKVQYVYEIRNACNPNLNPLCDTARIKAFSRVRNGDLKDLMTILPPGAEVVPDQSRFYIESGVEFDFCANKTVNTNVIITADTSPGLVVGSCAAEAEDIFNIGFVPDKPCNVAIDLACFIEDARGTKTNCKDVPMPEDDDECIKEVTYAYIISNIGEREKSVLSLYRTRDGVRKDLESFLDRNVVPPGQFGVARETDSLDFCQSRVVTTTVDIESEAYGVGDLKCSDQDTHSFTINIMCDVEVQLQCFADESRGFTVPCNAFNPFLNGNGNPGCEHALKLVYTVNNSGPGPEAVTELTVTTGNKKSNILPQQFKIEPDETKQFTDVVIVDYCNDFPEGMKSVVEVKAKMVPKGGSCSAMDDYTLTLPRALCDINIDPYIRCTLDFLGRDVSCLDYISNIDDPTDSSQCMREVKYEVTLINQGLSCVDVESVTGRLEGKSPVDITPAGKVRVCPKKNFVVVHYSQQNLCDDDLRSEIIVEVNGGPPETCGGFGSLTYIPAPSKIEECQVKLSVSCTDKSGNSCEVARGQEACDSPPTYLDLKYNGKSCKASSNELGSKFTCNDLDSLEDLGGVFITIKSKSGKSYFGASVAKGQTFRVGNAYHELADDLVVNVKSGGKLLQSMTFHASCSHPISTRDVFGSLTLLGFGDGDKNVVATDNEFDIEYEVTNLGDTTALLEELLVSTGNDQLSRVYLELFQLKAGGTYKGSGTVELSTDGEPITVTAELVAESLSAIKCNVDDSIMIGVGDPPTPGPTTSPTYEPTSGPTMEPTELEKCKCIDHPYAYKFKFVGGTCEDSDNSQKFWCTDKMKVQDWSHIVVTNDDSSKTYFEGKVKQGQYFEIKSGRKPFDGYTIFKIMVKDQKQSDWQLAQAVKFDTSCKSDLYLGDRFGSIEVVGWYNKKQGKVVEGGDNKC